MPNILIGDPASHTGWAMFNIETHKLVKSGCIYPKGDNKFLNLELELKEILKKYQPIKAYIEKLYTFPITAVVVDRRTGIPRRISLSKQNQSYGAYWQTVNKVISEFGCPCEYLETRRLAKKNVAKALARNYIKKKRFTSHEAEAVTFGLYVLKRDYNLRFKEKK